MELSIKNICPIPQKKKKKGDNQFLKKVAKKPDPRVHVHKIFIVFYAI